MNQAEKVIKDLKKVKGLANFHILTEMDKLNISLLEEKRNTGVFECLNRPNIIVLTHNSKFRPPVKPIVQNNIFPPVPFPEVKAKNVVSSSPSLKVHNYLIKRFKLKLKKEDATLLIGFE